MSHKPRPGILYKRSQSIVFNYSVEEVTTAWALITREPSISIRRLCKIMGIGQTRAAALVDLLKESGYIAQGISKTNARVVNIPYLAFEFQVKKV